MRSKPIEKCVIAILTLANFLMYNLFVAVTCEHMRSVVGWLLRGLRVTTPAIRPGHLDEVTNIPICVYIYIYVHTCVCMYAYTYIFMFVFCYSAYMYRYKYRYR